MALPGVGSVYCEAESASVTPPMRVGADPSVSGGRFVWMPAKPSEKATSVLGSATWRLEVARAGAYFIWGRVQTPTPENDSFYVRLFSDWGTILGWTDRPIGVHETWRWVPLTLSGGREPTPLELPAGMVNLQLRVREAGARIDRLFVTPRAGELPR